MRLTFDDKEYSYQILNTNLINKHTTELELIFNGEKVELIMDERKTWVLKDENVSIEPNLVQALGRSVSLRMRM